MGLGLFFAEQALKGGGIKRRKVETHTRFVQKGRQALAGMQGALFRQIGRSLTHKFALRHNGCHGDILFYSPIAVVPSFGNALPAGRHKTAPKQAASNQSAAEQGGADAPAVKPNVEFDQFKALDLRVGTVKVAEKHPNADRILRLEIDFGEGELRQILSGLAEHYAPEDLVGKRVCAVLNLAPRKIRGLVSHGMVLTAGTDSALGLLAVDRDVPDGSEIA